MTTRPSASRTVRAPRFPSVLHRRLSVLRGLLVAIGALLLAHTAYRPAILVDEVTLGA